MKEDRLRPGRPGKDCPPQQPKNPDERIAEAAERIAAATEKLVPTSNPQLDMIEGLLRQLIVQVPALQGLAQDTAALNTAINSQPPQP